MRYPVNEIFETLQGEGRFTGMPAIFVRLQGCPVGCSWCDTKHTWEQNSEDERPLGDILVKTAATSCWAWATPEAMLATFAERGFNAKLVVITGGEPCMFDLVPLCEALHSAGYSTQIETSGTFEINVPQETVITLSPKVGMKGGYAILDSALERADDIKHPVARERDIEELDALLARCSSDKPVYLQPVSQGKRATKLCITTCIKRNWRLSVQLHKYLGIE
ncbi:7-carboxy-7-deazaguanine synthase QueE [Gallaecimonas pentaromativorans]|uniref:7-carboxy-7-deazaguanine synthase n=1 Tax=Gallaecimonas pentaromativorans TaxID=584787 RepID=A0A3N1PTC2_9GAMM|nr:7-carboxy-7-deazaguanine synthase QueE [Gallaecimonas pentaromativorans]ROQ30037.1 7-carboxy-7-deazaguanine synthase [Gallaecimonas pentaromativorans]